MTTLGTCYAIRCVDTGEWLRPGGDGVVDGFRYAGTWSTKGGAKGCYTRSKTSWQFTRQPEYLTYKYELIELEVIPKAYNVEPL